MDNFEAQRQISAAFREGVREGRTQLIREIDDIVAKYDWQSDHLYAFSELLEELGVSDSEVRHIKIYDGQEFPETVKVEQHIEKLIGEFAEAIGYGGNVSVVKGLLSGELEVGHIEIDGFRNSKEIQAIEKVEMSND